MTLPNHLKTTRQNPILFTLRFLPAGQAAARIQRVGIIQRQYPRTHCYYKEYMDIEIMSSNLLKNIVNSGIKPG